ncbi:MAG TPA: hypothetical protein VGR85_03125 [Candidatus Limnocylindria bacterium]|nr:hypothetical protein [Candidatus Limnocylindria bacterium]
MRALTPNEVAILKSRLQIGPQGHSQRVKVTGRVPVAGSPDEFTFPVMPWAVEMPNGQAGVLFSGVTSDLAAPGRRVYLLRYDTEHTGTVKEVFPYASLAYGLVVWDGKLLAVCQRPSDGALRYRTSTDSAQTWSAEAALGITLADATHLLYFKGPAFQLTTNKAGDKLLMFYYEPSTFTFPLNLFWRETTNADPTLGWSAEADTLANVPSVGRNYGGSVANNQGFQRNFVMCETETANLWAMACESDDGDWHANHMCATGQLGSGGFTNRLNVGYGGGLSGNQGANGGVFLNAAGDLLFYVMTDGGEVAEIWKSTDSGSTWSAGTQMIPAGTMYAEGLGGGCGAVIDGYVGGPEYVWGATVSTYAGARPAMGVADAGNDLANLPNWTRILGAAVDDGFGAFVDDVKDISERVRAISLQKDDAMDAASFNIELHNVDGAVNPNDPTAELYEYVKPGRKVQIEQWYGDVANAARTFTGYLSQMQGSSNDQLVTLVGIDRARKLLRQDVDPSAPQVFGAEGAVRDMGNYVYLNKTIVEVQEDLLRKAFIVPETEAVLWPSTYVFKELVFSSGSLQAAMRTACAAAGLRCWWDEDGIFRTWPLIGGTSAAGWTFKSSVDVTTLATELDDDESYTRVRIVGKANIGAKYLQELLYWNGLGAPKGIDYDPLTGDVWYLDGNGSLYRLDPENSMAIIAGPFALGLTNLDGISVDPNDDHVWLSHNATYRKLDRANGSTLVGPFGAPDSNRCGIWAWNDAGTTKLKMVTRTTEDIVTMSVGGAELSRVACPVAKPTAISGDSGGGLYITGLDLVDFYQVDFAGNIVNTIKQAYKNGADLGIIDRPTTAYDFGDVYQIFPEGNSIIKYAVAGTPENVERATIAEAVDVALEIELGEIHRKTVVDLSISDKAMAEATAAALLRDVKQLRRRLTKGAVGHPGLQLNDRVTLYSPGDALDGDFVVRSIRSDQVAADGTYMMVCVLEPYREPGQ